MSLEICTRCKTNFDTIVNRNRCGCWCGKWWCCHSCAIADGYVFSGDAYETDLVDCNFCRKQWCKGSCGRYADRKLVWLKDKDGKAARIEIMWCGKNDFCTIKKVLKNCWSTSQPQGLIVDGQDYELFNLQGEKTTIPSEFSNEYLKGWNACRDAIYELLAIKSK